MNQLTPGPEAIARKRGPVAVAFRSQTARYLASQLPRSTSAVAGDCVRKVKIQLIYPDPNPRVGLSGRKVESAALQLLAALTPASHDVSIVQEHLGDDIRFNDPGVDLVGITAMTIQARRAYQIADGYRAAGKTVVLGGIHPSVLPNEALLHRRRRGGGRGRARLVAGAFRRGIRSPARHLSRGRNTRTSLSFRLCGAIFSQTVVFFHRLGAGGAGLPV